ncbi:Dynamin central region-domain-containing protein [Lactarius pseudohatsudake]|nr:Dynamin central region-domain-containing protein [Lactarius pseudohatsudake]
MSTGFGAEIVATINKLQDVFTAVGSSAAQIDLPQICVLGVRVAGRNIVGRDFLPRGSGIVTRRPLVLQLIHRPATTAGPTANGNAAAAPGADPRMNDNEWGEFLHLPNEKFYDFNKIRAEIVRDTEAKTGRNAGISPQPINLRIFSPNVLTLTLVDLPGLTKVPVGDQPKDIEKQIPCCIVLAVTPANTDLANSDGLKMAREVDPEGTRTIGVLTKVDLMDAGTDVVDILAGRVIPLRLGYVPVVNRGQRDIDTSKPIQQALDAERHFFESHPAYQGKAQYCGTPFLARKLNMILMHHIRATLPDIKARITSQLQKFSAELQSLGGPLGDGNSSSIVLNIITEFTNEFRTVIDGNTNDLSLNELSGGARISFVFHELFNNGVKSIDPFDQVKDGYIRTILYNSSGSTPALFVGTAAFEVIVKQQIKRLEEPGLKCCQLVYDELIRILGQLLAKIQAFRRYPALRERFNSVVVNFFKTAMTPTTKLVIDMVAMQACYVNTTHPDFLNGHKAMALPKPGKMTAAQLNNNKDLEVDVKKEEPKPAAEGEEGPQPMEAPPAIIRPQSRVIKLLIHSYFNIVKREMIDMENLQRELLQELYSPTYSRTFSRRATVVVARRKEVVSMVQALTKRRSAIVAGV